MKIKIVALIAALFIVCSALHFVEPTAAASAKKGYLVDTGTTYFQDETSPHLYYKFVWKTYKYSNNLRKVKTIQYKKYSKNAKWKLFTTGSATMYKISKTKLKVIDTFKIDGKTYKTIYYVKTKLNTRNYYWKVYRKALAKSSPE